MAQLCPICSNADLVTEEERRNLLCAACTAKVRIPRSADPRPRVPCRGCGHTVLLRTQLLDQDGEFATKRAGVAITDPKVDYAAFGGQVKAIRAGVDSKGPLTVYVCRGCGLTELYTDDFADLPVGPQYGSVLIDVAPSTGPFR